MTSTKTDNAPKESLRETISAYIDVGLIVGLFVCAGTLIKGPPQLAGIALRTGDTLNRIAEFRRKRKGRASL